MKTCSRCKASKPLDEFYTNRSSNDGFNYYCKACAKAYCHAYYRDRSAIVKEREHRWSKRQREHTELLRIVGAVVEAWNSDWQMNSSKPVEIGFALDELAEFYGQIRGKE